MKVWILKRTARKAPERFRQMGRKRSVIVDDYWVTALIAVRVCFVGEADDPETATVLSCAGIPEIATGVPEGTVDEDEEEPHPSAVAASRSAAARANRARRRVPLGRPRSASPISIKPPVNGPLPPPPIRSMLKPA